jgi:hypothetical protein
MKSKILLFALFAALSFGLSAQPLNWYEDSPANFDPMTVIEDLVNFSEGTKSAKLTFTETGTPWFVSDEFNITSGTPYSFSIDFLDNDAGGEYNVRLYFVTGAGTTTNVSSAFTVDNTNWQTLSLSGTSPADAVKVYIVIRILDVAASWTGSATFNIDNASYTENGGANLVQNPGFEEWVTAPQILTYSFQELTPAVTGTINNTAFTVGLTVPFATNVTNLVASFTLSEGASAKVGEVDQVSGTTSNDFTSAVTYTLTGADLTIQNWVVTVSKAPASSSNFITSFAFEAIDPIVYGVIDNNEGTITLEVPTGTNVAALVPTIAVSAFATVSPESGIAQNFAAPVEYTVTAQDESTKVYTVTVQQSSNAILFQEYFENVPRVIPAGYTLINNDGYTPNAGDMRWADSAWVVTNTNRPEWAGNHMAVALSYYTDMPAEGRTDDWLVLPSITVGANSVLSWKAMSLTSSGNYPDDYRVIAAPSSTVESPTVTYFEENGFILQTINNESWSAAVGNPGNGVSERSLNLNQWFTNQPIWIAYVLITGDGGGSYLAIDEIKVIEAGTGLDNNNLGLLKVDLYPNPASGLVNLVLNSNVNANANVEIVDLVGRQVYSSNSNVNIGENRIELNASDLNSGIYLVRTSVNGKVNVTKLVVK